MTRFQSGGSREAPTTPREAPACGRCPACHPGRSFGGDEFCRVLKDIRPWVRDCACHPPRATKEMKQ